MAGVHLICLKLVLHPYHVANEDAAALGMFTGWYASRMAEKLKLYCQLAALVVLGSYQTDT